MVSPKTPVLVGLTTLVVAFAAGPAEAASTTTLAAGVLSGPDGKPSAGVVQLTAWPVEPRPEGLPVVASAVADGRGRFRVATADMDRLRGLASESQRGRLDIIAEGTTTDGRAGSWVFSRFIRPAGGARERSAGDTARVGAFADPQHDVDGPSLKIAATGPADARAGAAVSRSVALRPGSSGASPVLVPTQGVPCVTDDSRSTSVQWTPIGELNNAYSDTLAIFRYGKVADTSISVASSGGGGPFELSGSVTVSNEIENQLTRKAKKYSRTLFSKFEYERIARLDLCRGTQTVTVRAVKLIGSLGSQPLSGTTRVCNPRNPRTNVYRGNDEYKRSKRRARSFAGGVKVFGVGLDASSGFSDSVSVEYLFGGSDRRAHYLCGEGGKAPTEGGRIFSGARP